MTQPVARRRVAILISGRGSNMVALAEACADPAATAEIVLVASNRADAGGIAHARSAGLATAVVPHRDYADRAAHEAALDRALTDAGVELVCLAGYMRLLTGAFVARWRGRMINIHPSLLPAFKGLDTHARVLEGGVRITGCTVHFVAVDMDAGPIIAQAAVPVEPADTADQLAARVLAAEHVLYPAALAAVARGDVVLAGDRAEWRADTGAAAVEERLFSPSGCE